MSQKLVLFSQIHILTSLTVVLIIASIIWYCRIKKITFKAKFSLFLIIYYFADAIIRNHIKPLTPIEYVPLHICSILFFIAAYSHYKKSILGHQISIFWTYASTLQSLITPTLKDGVFTIEFFRYFLTHGLIIFNATYVLFVLKTKITFRSLIKSFIAMQVLLATAFITNLIFDVNFIFLKTKPPSPTPVDLLGPWPWYIIGVDLVCLMLFLLIFAVIKIFKVNRM